MTESQIQEYVEQLVEEALEDIVMSCEHCVIEEAKKKTLEEMIDAFRDLYKTSAWDDLRVLTDYRKVYGEDTLELKIVTDVVGSQKDQEYKTVIVLRRPNLETEWSIDLPAEVRCTCPTYKFRNIYSNKKNKNNYGKTNNWANVPAKKTNPRDVVTLCKHIFAATKSAIQDGIIKK